jgi:hypothetical protein
VCGRGWPYRTAPVAHHFSKESLQFHRWSGAIWQVPISQAVGLNGDEIVDGADMSLIVDHWRTDNSETNKTLATLEELAT